MMSSYRHSTANGDGACDVNNNNSNDDHNDNLLTADNLLRLALKKPKSWNWELTTSSSSPNITFPKIQLFDGASGELMVEVDRPDCVIRSGCSDTVPKSGGSSPSRYRRSRTSLVREKLTTTGDSLADIFSQLQNKGLGHKLTTSGSQYRLLQGAQADESARGSLQKSKSANAIVVTPEVPPIVRRRSRRSLASRSSSILERISEFYGRSSTEEEDVLPAVPQLLLEPASDAGSPGQDEGVTIEELPADDDGPAETAIKVPPRPKIYKLVRSNIGTLMVREESFHTQRSLRRRQREAGGERVPSPPELVELDEQTDRPRPVPGGAELDRKRYEREISRIDGLLSRVMLSHDLQTEELTRADLGPSIRVEDAPEDVLVREVMNGLSTEHQNGTTTRRPRRRSRRSVSVGGSVTSPHRLRSASSSSTSDGEQDRGYRGTRLSGQHRTGSSSRSGSQKRRGRTRHRDPDVGPHATISNAAAAAAAAAPSCQRAATTVPHCPGGRRFSADGGGPDTLALERFRASLARRPDSHDASAITIDVPAIGASASTAAASAATNTRQCAVQPNSSSSSTSASSSGSTLSTLSPWTSGADSETQSPATGTISTTAASNYPLGRSISVPCGTPRESSSAEHDFLERLRRSLVPITGDALRRRYLMENTGQQEQTQQQQQQQPAEVPVVLRRDPPGRRHLRTMSSVVEQVLYTQRAAATTSSSGSSHGKPPTGRRTLSPPTSDEPGTAGQAAKRAPEEAPEPPEEPPLSSELANTVEPPYRGRRTLKYYTRRYRTSIHYDNP